MAVFHTYSLILRLTVEHNSTSDLEPPKLEKVCSVKDHMELLIFCTKFIMMPYDWILRKTIK